MNKVKMGSKKVGGDEPTYFIADIAANHDGNLDRACKLIELAKESGADAAKFQNFEAGKIVSKSGFDDLGSMTGHQAKWDKSVFDVYKKASLPQSWTEKLKNRCDEVGIEYFTSPYDLESVDQVDDYVNSYKIGSGDVTWHEVISKICSKGKPIFIATGACDLEDVEAAVSLIKKWGNPLILMQCNTNYTGSTENLKYINLRVLDTYKKKFPGVVLGLSDHTAGHLTVLGAVALGARVVEKHFTDDETRDGPDHTFSMTPPTWSEMVRQVRDLEQALGDGVKRIEYNEVATSVLQRRALRYRRDMKAGMTLSENDIIALRPRPPDGLDPQKLRMVVNQRLTVDVKKDGQLKMADFE
jgi:sialic acid synthase SpsE